MVLQPMHTNTKNNGVIRARRPRLIGFPPSPAPSAVASREPRAQSARAPRRWRRAGPAASRPPGKPTTRAARCTSRRGWHPKDSLQDYRTPPSAWDARACRWSLPPGAPTFSNPPSPLPADFKTGGVAHTVGVTAHRLCPVVVVDRPPSLQRNDQRTPSGAVSSRTDDRHIGIVSRADVNVARSRQTLRTFRRPAARYKALPTISDAPSDACAASSPPSPP